MTDIRDHVENVRSELTDLNLGEEPSYSPSTLEYFEYYGLQFPGVKHHFGTFTWEDCKLAAHIFRPHDYRATVILLHGHLTHSGLLTGLIKTLTAANYAVAVYDAPGHGLSAGGPAAIDDFAAYLAILENFAVLCRKYLHGPFHLVGHSMGCAAALDYVIRKDPDFFSGVVLVAPLVRSCLWNLSRFGHSLIAPWRRTLPRKFRRNSSDMEFLRFVRRDPLQVRVVSTAWVRALFRWNGRIQDYPSVRKGIKIVQGTDDRTVAWKHNIAFLRQKFSKAHVVLIDGGRHELLNETRAICLQVLSEILGHLSEKAE